ncbi:glycosyltransferase [Flavobacterium sp. N3904]|uniref:glycosyltransferase n=1 Tax=Flavobacterium sp. N3904 TaxID=2986835 RepID=UPI002224F28C|nr:glycosyltransferase [Flavobacterium sp. N3904]
MLNRIYIYPRYSSKGPSSRYRIYNYLEYYKEEGYSISVHPLFGDWYLDSIWEHRPKWKIFHKIFFAYFKRLILILSMPSNSIAYIGAELFPYLPYGFENIFKLKKVKYIIEFDDAIFHYYDMNASKHIRKFLGNKTAKAIVNASYVITGAEYLTNFAMQYNQSVLEIPTAINAEKYISSEPISGEEFVVGWIGSFSQSIHIINLLPVFKRLSENYRFKLRLVGFDKYLEKYLKGIPYEIIVWTDEGEIAEMSKFSVGIMPLDDSPFSNGKCAFKLIQYMGVGIPTISTPLRSNINVNRDSANIFASTQEEWYIAFEKVIQNKEHYIKVGQKNKEIAMEFYTIQANYAKYLSVFKSLFSRQ